MEQARLAWKQKQALWDPRRLVFIDETGLNTKMTRLYGRSAVGERCRDAVPHGHWHSSTFLAALRHDGFTAPLLIDGALDGDMFRAYVEQSLAATLSPGDIVILDNLSSHKVHGVRQAIEARGAHLLYLPAYSPDLNPIEMAFSKIKAFLRRACARTYEELMRAVADCLSLFTPQECINYFTHAHYVSI
ncbi:MAG: IS630 family transposase [Candidatus Methylacidiphilales bacterium]|nr:IS630 family transposase [Candidatus Methylacidiphilales bacterium]